MKTAAGFLLVCALVMGMTATAEPAPAAWRALVERTVPERAPEFAVEKVAAEGDLDVYEIESAGGKATLRGSSGVAIGLALNEYLGRYCNASFSLCGSQLDLPRPLPDAAKVRVVVPFRYRYSFNYCCFSYSMAWWDWPQWERIIDWMALHGVNMPLAVTGQEAVWQGVGRQLGLSDAEMSEFFVGPAYLPFGWMGCIDGWAGPLPQSWIERHEELQRKVLARERELGMKPVLQGFTGHVPKALRGKFPEAKFETLPSWCGFPPTIFVDPQDPLFRKLGKMFVEEQTRRFGTDHFYASDTFIEMPPLNNDPAFLRAMGEAVYGAMADADPEAVWVMQGWIFFNAAQFWQPPQAKALLGSAPEGRLLVLDLYCELNPVWSKTEAFYGQDWCWSIIQNFGNQVSLHGGLPQIAEGLVGAYQSPQRGRLVGTGFLMEGLGWNPVVYDLMRELIARPETLNVEEWVDGYARRRYGREHVEATEAWRALLRSVYATPYQATSLVTARPAVEESWPWVNTKYGYDTAELDRAWKLLLDCRDELGALDTYRYDLVHVARQALGNRAPELYKRVIDAYKARDVAALDVAGTAYLGLIDDLDRLLATRREFLLGRWLRDARGWATNEEERRLYEWNARNQVTLWGPQDGILNDYANKQWSGLLRDFYRPRWERFFAALRESVERGAPLDGEALKAELQAQEEAWTHRTERYPEEPDGEPVAVALALFEKYTAQDAAR